MPTIAERRAATIARLQQANTVQTVATLPADLKTPCLISHITHIGIRQIKRVDTVELDATTDPRVLDTLGIPRTARLARLTGDTTDLDGNPVGALRGWQTYVDADAILDVVA